MANTSCRWVTGASDDGQHSVDSCSAALSCSSSAAAAVHSAPVMFEDAAYIGRGRGGGLVDADSSVTDQGLSSWQEALSGNVYVGDAEVESSEHLLKGVR